MKQVQFLNFMLIYGIIIISLLFSYTPFAPYGMATD